MKYPARLPIRISLTGGQVPLQWFLNEYTVGLRVKPSRQPIAYEMASRYNHKNTRACSTRVSRRGINPPMPLVLASHHRILRSTADAQIEVDRGILPKSTPRSTWEVRA